MSGAPVLTVQEAAARLAAEPTLRYLDLRPVHDFAQGRPLARCLNVPFAFRHPTGGEWHPNPDFAAIVRWAAAEVTGLLLGGDDGIAVAEAAAALVAAGCPGVAVVEGGLTAWRAALLPTTRENREGTSYVSLLTGYRRKDKPAKAAHGH